MAHGRRKGRKRKAKDNDGMPPNAQPLGSCGSGSEYHCNIASGVVVVCKNCKKPRVIFAPNIPRYTEPQDRRDGFATNAEEKREGKRMAAATLQDAMDGKLYVCGGQPLPEDHPLIIGIFYCYGMLECYDNVQCPNIVIKREAGPLQPLHGQARRGVRFVL
jgi:hypothetical protein